MGGGVFRGGGRVQGGEGWEGQRTMCVCTPPHARGTGVQNIKKAHRDDEPLPVGGDAPALVVGGAVDKLVQERQVLFWQMYVGLRLGRVSRRDFLLIDVVIDI